MSPIAAVDRSVDASNRSRTPTSVIERTLTYNRAGAAISENVQGMPRRGCALKKLAQSNQLDTRKYPPSRNTTPPPSNTWFWLRRTWMGFWSELAVIAMPFVTDRTDGNAQFDRFGIRSSRQDAKDQICPSSNPASRASFLLRSYDTLNTTFCPSSSRARTTKGALPGAV